MAANNIPVTVVADDTDVLVMLVHHFRPEMADICMLSEIIRKRTPHTAVTPVRAVRDAIGHAAADQLLVIHALSGCDTTSALFSHGKAGVFRLLVKSADSSKLTDIVGSPDAS